MSSTNVEVTNNKTLNILSSPSSTITSSSSSTSFHNKTMEEVWKDINLSSLHHKNNTTTTRSQNTNHNFSMNATTLTHNHQNNNPNNDFILQDFFARPTTIVSSSNNNNQEETNLYGSPLPAPPPPPPATVLSLNSTLGFDFLDHHHHHHNLTNSNVVVPFSNPFEVLAASSGRVPSCGKRRSKELDGSNTGERRHKRMIKNRESAARSRARKQAYTNELELEVAHLMEENARLKKQQDQLVTAAAAQLPKKHTLQRTSTAPF